MKVGDEIKVAYADAPSAPDKRVKKEIIKGIIVADSENFITIQIFKDKKKLYKTSICKSDFESGHAILM